MRYFIILFIIISRFAICDAQNETQPGIRDYQISGGALYDSILYILGTDTVDASAKQGLAKWYRYDDLSLGGGSTNLSIGQSAGTQVIQSSTGTDVGIRNLYGLLITEGATDTLHFRVDSSQVATQYDLTLISSDHDWYEEGGTSPPNAITDLMFHNGPVAIEQTTTESDYSLTIDPQTRGIVMDGEVNDYVPLAMRYAATNDNWFLYIDDVNNFLIGNTSSTPTTTYPITIEPLSYGSGGSTIYLQTDGDVQLGDYPNTRDDGSPANVLGTDASGVIQSYPVGDVTPDTDDQDITVTGASQPFTLDLEGDATDATFTGAGITVVTEPTANNLVFTSTEIDGSTTNEAWTIDGDAGDTEVISNQTVLFAGAGIAATSYSSAANTLTITATEVDGSTTNEAWTIDADDADTEVISNQTVRFEGLGDINTNYIPATNTMEIEYVGAAGGDGIYGGDGTTPADVDAAVTDSLEFNGTLKIINDANDFVGIGAQSPEAKLHIKSTTTGVLALEHTGTTTTVDIKSKSIISGVTPPFSLNVYNKDIGVDLSGDYYQVGNITFSKLTDAGGSINFNIGYDSTNLDGVLTLKSRESGATDGLVNVAGGLRFKWRTDATSAATFNTGDYGITMTTTGAKTATVPDATSTLVGQTYFIFNSGASGDITISITGGSGDTIYGDTIVGINESVTITCPETGVWISN